MKVAVVTGTSRGLGEAFAKSLLSKGYTVFGGSRSASKIEHENFIDIELDIASETSVKKFFKEIAKETEVIDIFVNNAGFFELSSIGDLTSSELQEHIQTNTMSSFYLYKNLEEFIIEEESLFVNILPINSLETFVDTAAFSAASSAKLSFLKVLAKEWEKYHIRFSNLFLGATATDLWNNYEEIEKEKMLDISQVLEVFSFIVNSNSNTKIEQIIIQSKNTY
jgi:NAD(P)-dependent dehydrogenase (short-subunit alcohol dehydrogenase family)